MAELSPCSHIEAATACKRCCAEIHRKLSVHTVDAVVEILAITMFNQIDPVELRLSLDSKLHFIRILIHKVVKGLDVLI